MYLYLHPERALKEVILQEGPTDDHGDASLRVCGHIQKVVHGQPCDFTLLIADHVTLPEDLVTSRLWLYNDLCNTLPPKDSCPVIPTATGCITSPSTQPADVMHHMMTTKFGLAIVQEEEAARYQKWLKCSQILYRLLNAHSIYRHIIQEDRVVDLVDVLCQQPDREDWMNRFLFADKDGQALRSLANDLLNASQKGKVYHPITQEEQVALFLDWSKQIQGQKTEAVSDAFIERMKQHEAYQWLVDGLSTHGFKLSETQQFNSLQHAGLILQKEDPVLYNLSDMGAGKTLMTIEAIFYAQQVLITQSEETLAKTSCVPSQMILPDIQIIAPTLSLKSSWLDTIALFVSLTQEDDYHYSYTLTKNGHSYQGHVYLSGFTATTQGITLQSHLPEPLAGCLSNRKSYLIIDEIHQLLDRPLKASRFIPHLSSIYTHYTTFVLSGTLANLTTRQWYNMIRFLDLPDNQWGNSNHTPTQCSGAITACRDLLDQQCRTMSETLQSVQHRQFDPEDIQGEPLQWKEKKLTKKEEYYAYRYGTVLASMNPSALRAGKTLQEIIEQKQYQLTVQPDVLSTTNFELFYRLVAGSAVTAESKQIATELFGEQATQHPAQLIKANSQLSEKDLALLKRLYAIVHDANVYKSVAFATQLANVLLNLNDGLSTQSVYDLINRRAEHHPNFLAYLTQLDTHLLKDLQQSTLIQLPKLEETEKFQILQHLLETEKDETFLIITNSKQSAIQLAKALKVKPLTNTQMTNAVDYQATLDTLFSQQSIVVVPQLMIKSSLDLVQVNRLVQYQLNTEVSDMVQAQNRMNRIGQTRETRAYYIATDQLQGALIDLFLETYRNIKVAHKGIIELFVDIEQQIDVISDYMGQAFKRLEANTFTWTLKNPTTTLTVHVDAQLANRLQSDQFIWYHHYLLGQDADGKSLVIQQMKKSQETPQLFVRQAS